MSPIKQRLLTAIEQTPEPLLEQTLKFLENLLNRTLQTSASNISFDPDTDSTAQIMSDLKESFRQAQAGQTYPIAELWDGMNV